MNFTYITELKVENITLKKITVNDQTFINEMFLDSEVRKFYIVNKDAPQDNSYLVRYWLNDISKGTGYAWIIYIKNPGIFSSNKPCGFIAFEQRGSEKNIHLSYALHPAYRKKGILTKSLNLVIVELERLSVSTIIADIDKDNLNSSKVVERLGFTTDKTSLIIDPDMLRNGEIRMRYLWRKDFFDFSKLGFFIINEKDFHKLITSKTVFKVWDEFDNRNYQTGKYHLLFQSNVTEKLVGLSENAQNVYSLPWELLREENIQNKKFLIFCGWGDEDNGGHFQFENHEIGIEKFAFAQILENLMVNYPDTYSQEIMRNVIGLKGFKFSQV